MGFLIGAIIRSPLVNLLLTVQFLAYMNIILSQLICGCYSSDLPTASFYINSTAVAAPLSKKLYIIAVKIPSPDTASRAVLRALMRDRTVECAVACT
jgi:hypothetical protein